MANRLRPVQFGLFAAAVLLVFTLSSSALAATKVLSNSTPGFVATAQNLGPENSSKVIPITVPLQLHNLAARDALLRQMYTPGSPNYHKWLTPAQHQIAGVTARLFQRPCRQDPLPLPQSHPP